MWLWKKDKQALETDIDDLRSSVKALRNRLIEAKVLRGQYNSYSLHLFEDIESISLIDLKDQIEGIKNFLDIKYVTKPEVPAESTMERLPSTDDDGS